MLRHALFMGLRRNQEFHRNDVGALVQQLEEGMLAIGAGLAPHQRPRRIARSHAGFRHPLAVGLHVELLQIGGKAREPLVIGNDGAGRILADIAVPDADEPHEQWQVGSRIRRLEMFIHRISAFEEALEMIWPNGNHQRQADGRPDGIAPANPIPESENPLRRRCRRPPPCRVPWKSPRNAMPPPPRPASPQSTPAPSWHWSWFRWW